MTDNAIQITDLVKYYGRLQALKGVSLEVGKGTVFGFLGPNGAGKTTTIRCMLDMIRPHSGEIRIFGLDPQQDPVAVRARVGYLPGELNLEGNLKVQQTLHYFADLRGNRIDWQFVRTLAERLELDLGMAVKNLSKGNKQKVGVVQALMHRPELLILDEPTSGLDPLMQQEVYRLLREAQQNGATIFFSSHIIREVESIADRAAIIRAGRIVEESEPEVLGRMEVRTIRVRFRDEIDDQQVSGFPDVTRLVRERRDVYSFTVSGEIDGFIKALAGLPVIDLDVERPSLEELFLAHYTDEEESVHVR